MTCKILKIVAETSIEEDAQITNIKGHTSLALSGATVIEQGDKVHIEAKTLLKMKGQTVNNLAAGDNIIKGGKIKLN